MRRIITTTFVTLDGVMQAPGAPQEDTSGGFTYGGWSVHYWDGLMGELMNDIMAQPFELLLGSKTYDIFAAHWPTSKEEPVASTFNATRKFVVSGKPKELSWQNSELVTGNVVGRLKELKSQDGPDLWVHGSGEFIQTLIKNHLVDRMLVWVFPVTVGRGKRLFEAGVPPQEFKLVDAKTASTGVIIAIYEPSGELQLGSFAGT
jgi:dihydrofolate reductase